MMLFALYKQQEMSTAVLAKPEHTNECLYILLPGRVYFVATWDIFSATDALDCK